MSNREPEETAAIKPGQSVYDDEGRRVGVVRGVSEREFVVAPDDGSVTLEHDPGGEFGEGYLVWRCSACGEVGELSDGLPGTCPSCGAPGEELYAWLED